MRSFDLKSADRSSSSESRISRKTSAAECLTSSTTWWQHYYGKYFSLTLIKKTLSNAHVSLYTLPEAIWKNTYRIIGILLLRMSRLNKINAIIH